MLTHSSKRFVRVQIHVTGTFTVPLLHRSRFGNIETLQWVRPAPLYDNGSSLWANTATKLIGEPYKAKPFQADAKQQLQLVQTWSWLDETKLDGFADEVYDILMQNPLCEQVRCTAIAQQVQQRIDTLIIVHKYNETNS